MAESHISLLTTFLSAFHHALPNQLSKQLGRNKYKMNWHVEEIINNPGLQGHSQFNAFVLSLTSRVDSRGAWLMCIAYRGRRVGLEVGKGAMLHL